MMLKRYIFSIVSAALLFGCNNPAEIETADLDTEPAVTGKVVNNLYDCAVFVKNNKVYCGRVGDSDLKFSWGDNQWSAVSKVAFNKNGFVIAVTLAGECRLGFLLAKPDKPVIAWSGIQPQISNKPNFECTDVKLNNRNEFVIIYHSGGNSYYASGTMESSSQVTFKNVDKQIMMGTSNPVLGYVSIGLGGPDQDQIAACFVQNGIGYCLPGLLNRTNYSITWFPNNLLNFGPNWKHISVDMSETCKMVGSGKIIVMGQYLYGNYKNCFFFTGNTHPTQFDASGVILLDGNVVTTCQSSDPNRAYSFQSIGITDNAASFMSIHSEKVLYKGQWSYREAWKLDPNTNVATKFPGSVDKIDDFNPVTMWVDCDY